MHLSFIGLLSLRRQCFSESAVPVEKFMMMHNYKFQRLLSLFHLNLAPFFKLIYLFLLMLKLVHILCFYF